MEWTSTWDEQCEADYYRWIEANPKPSELEACAELFAILAKGYEVSGPDISTPEHSAIRTCDQATVEIYGHIRCSGKISLFVGVYQRDIRVLVLGPSNKYKTLELAKVRAENWNPALEKTIPNS